MAKLELLKGMKVIDMASFVAGPTCAKILAEYGADVIRIEALVGDDKTRDLGKNAMGIKNGDLPLYDLVNGNKKQLALDTRRPEGIAILKKLTACVRSLDPDRPVSVGQHGMLNLEILGMTTDKTFEQLQGTIQETPGVIDGEDYWDQQTANSWEQLDLAGYNYIWPRYGLDAVKHPDRVIIGTEIHPFWLYDYWKAVLEHDNCIGDFVELAAAVLSDAPLFFLLNSYTAGLSPSTMGYLLKLKLEKKRGGLVLADEIGLPVAQTGGVLPCGASARWTKLQ